MSPAARQDVTWWSQLAQRLQALFQGLFGPYRPELHYMRGLGPKWRAKHQRISASVRVHETMSGARRFEPQGL